MEKKPDPQLLSQLDSLTNRSKTTSSCPKCSCTLTHGTSGQCSTEDALTQDSGYLSSCRGHFSLWAYSVTLWDDMQLPQLGMRGTGGKNQYQQVHCNYSRPTTLQTPQACLIQFQDKKEINIPCGELLWVLETGWFKEFLLLD